MGRRLVTWIAGLLAVGFWVITVLLGISGMTRYQPQAASVAITERGVARVADCKREGPVGTNGLGYWWVCQADVVWDGGQQVRVTAQAGQLTPDDKGEVPVVQRGERAPRGSEVDNAPVYRADYEPSVLLGVGSMLAGLGVGGFVALAVFGTVLSRGKKAQERE